MITLSPTRPAHHPALTAYRLSEEQQAFTAQPHEWLDGTPIPEHAHPVTILKNGEPSGFFILDEGQDKNLYSANPRALLLRSMSINPAHQGKGIGTAALAALPAFVHAHLPHRDEIVLGVNHKNPAAHHLYLNSGFIDTGRTYMGKKSLQYILSLTLQTASTSGG